MRDGAARKWYDRASMCGVVRRRTWRLYREDDELVCELIQTAGAWTFMIYLNRETILTEEFATERDAERRALEFRARMDENDWLTRH